MRGTFTVRPTAPEYLPSSGLTMTALHAQSSSGLVLATVMLPPSCSNLMWTSFEGSSRYVISASAMVVPETQS